MTVHPWHREAWNALAADRTRLPHALLLHGRRGIGKRVFALELARLLLCQTPRDGTACGSCRSCHLFQVGTHPDFRLVEPQESGEGEEGGRAGTISIAQIRELTTLVELSSHQKGRRVIVIHPPEAMNPPAANALLKTLEEPADNTVFVLVSHQPRQLLATVVSRCRPVALPLPGRDEALAWLQTQGAKDAALCLSLAGGAPLEALRYADADTLAARQELLSSLADPQQMDWLRLAEQGARQDLPRQVEWLQKWLYDLLAARLAGKVRYNTDFAPRLRELGAGVNVKALLRFARQLDQVRRHVQHPLNAQLLLERVFFAYRQAVTTRNG